MNNKPVAGAIDQTDSTPCSDMDIQLNAAVVCSWQIGLIY